MEFFLKVTPPSCIILSISLDKLNWIDWLLKTWLWIILKDFLFYCCKRIFIWQNILEVFWRIHLNIIFWILLSMLTFLVSWILNINVSTTLKYCYKKSLNKKLKLMGGAVKYLILWSSGLRTFFWKICKTLRHPLLHTWCKLP